MSTTRRSIALVLGLALAALVLPEATTASAALFRAGFETGGTSAWKNVGVTVENSGPFAPAPEGDHYARFDSSGSSTFLRRRVERGRQLSVDLQANLRSVDGGFSVVRFQGTHGPVLALRVTSARDMQLQNRIAHRTFRSTKNLPARWVEIQVHIRTGRDPIAEVFFDGATTPFLSSTRDLGRDRIKAVQLGNKGPNAGFDLAIDDVRFARRFIGGGGGGGETAPDTPTNLRVVSTTSSSITIRWHGVRNADAYGVYRDGVKVGGDVNGTTYTDNGLDPSTRYHYRVDAVNGAGRSPVSDPIPATTSAGGGGTTVVMAAGDIACDPNDGHYNGSTPQYCQFRDTAQLLGPADVVLALGDTQYFCGGPSAYQQAYDPTWGQYKAKTYAIPADQEYANAADEPDGTDCSNNHDAAGYYDYFGARGGANGTVRGAYSVNVGGWHVVGLNSMCSLEGGCGHNQPMDDWLESDLQGTEAGCTIAMLHVPRFVSLKNGNKKNASMLPLWETMYNGGVDLVLDGNSHVYERFVPQDPTGNADNQGIVEMIVGTGGRGHGGLAAPADRFPNSAAGQASSFGVMELTLHNGSYDYDFLTAPGEPSYSDSGSASCTNPGH